MKQSDVEDILPLTPMQAGLLFQALYDADSQAYFLQMTFRLKGALDYPVFTQSGRLLCHRNTALRSAFLYDDLDRPVQIVFKERPPEMNLHDLCSFSRSEQQDHVEEYRQQDRLRGFDLQRDVLLRVAVFQLDECQYEFVWSYHHILVDGWSFGILQAEFRQIYAALLRGAAPVLPQVVPCRDYIRWQEAQDQDSARAYWAHYLSGYDQLAALPETGRHADDYELREHVFGLEKVTSAGLRALAARADVTLNTVIQCLWALLLARYNGVDDVVFGAIVSGRPAALPRAEGMVGLFINAVPVRIGLPADRLFTEVLRSVQEAALASESHHHLPVTDIQAQCALGRDLFNHLLTFENYPLEPTPVADGSPLGEFAVECVDVHDRTHYDLNVVVTPDDAIQIKFSYNGQVYSESHIARTAAHLSTAVESVLQAPDQIVQDIELLPTSEKEQLVRSFSPAQRTYPQDETLVEWFEAQVERTPEKPALLFPGGALSYHELNARANRVAHYLQTEHGVKPEDCIGVLLDRSPWVIAAIWGVLKAGAAYVPLETSCPQARLRYILQDSDCRLILTEDAHVEHVAECSPAPAVIVRQLPETQTTNPARVAGPQNLAYVIYTSGSTGAPKGCQVELGNLMHYLYWANRYYFADDPGGCFGLYSSLSFDLTVTSLFLPLLRGQAVYIFPQAAQVQDILQESFHPNSPIDSIKLTPAHISLLEHLELESTNIQLAIVGGEALALRRVQLLHALNPNMAVYNEYGPTEATVGCTVKRVEPDETQILIGRPIDNTRIYILNAGRLAPIGVSGELCVGGAGVARGYRNRPNLTAQMFIPDPFCTGERLYRTGDLACWQPDGNLELLGRNDDQVKVRGHRVELGEIEHQLLHQKFVRQAVVLAQPDAVGSKELVAYVGGEGTWEAADLREQLRAALPDYMIPSWIVRLEEMPLSANGKIDRRALLDRRPERPNGRTGYVPPRNEREALVSAVWQETLAVERVGVKDNFFDLGGHSLKMMQVVSRLRKTQGAQISLRDFFENPTVEALARRLRRAPGEAYARIEPAPEQEYYELSHAQQRIWLQHQLGATTAYNMPEAHLVLSALDVSALERAFATLLRRHEALRTAFVEVAGEPQQRIYPSLDFRVRQIDLSATEAPKRKAQDIASEEAGQPFDLSQPPLLRLTIIKLSATQHIILLTMHHIIGDGWSGTVLYQEIMALYEAYRSGQPNPLPPLRIQYKDYARWQLARDYAREGAYWLRQLAGMPAGLRLPYDQIPGGQREFAGSTERLQLSESVTGGFHALAAEEQTTISNVVLALFKLWLYQLTRQEDLCVGLAIANRNHPDLENLIGFFVNIMPIRTQVTAEMEFSELLGRVKENVYAALENQEYPFDLLVQQLNPGRYANGQPLVNVVYAFQSYSDVRVDIGLGNGPADAPVPSDLAQARDFEFNFETAKFDLTLFVLAEGGRLYLTLEYDTSQFRVKTIRKFLATLERFAHMLVSQTS